MKAIPRFLLNHQDGNRIAAVVDRMDCTGVLMVSGMSIHRNSFCYLTSGSELVLPNGVAYVSLILFGCVAFRVVFKFLFRVSWYIYLVLFEISLAGHFVDFPTASVRLKLYKSQLCSRSCGRPSGCSFQRIHSQGNAWRAWSWGVFQWFSLLSKVWNLHETTFVTNIKRFFKLMKKNIILISVPWQWKHKESAYGSFLYTPEAQRTAQMCLCTC